MFESIYQLVYWLWVMQVLLWFMIEEQQSCKSNAPLHLK